jgi:fibronectin type 3 domain-containing protein
VCVTPEDRFAPTPPKGLSAVGSEGAVGLIWEASPDADLAGYLVLRAEAGKPPAVLTNEPLKETTFRDATAVPGVRYTYTVVAVDTVGNRSEPSNSAEETAR